MFKPIDAAMLSLPFHRRHQRRTVWVTLLVWVLALLAGVANACLLQPHAPAAAASAASPHDALTQRGLHAQPALHAEPGHHDGHAGNGGPTTDAGKAGCLKFCDDESSTVAKVKTAQTDVAAPVIVASVAWPLALPTATVAMRRSAERPASHGPPLVIRLLRLTI